MLHDPVPLFLRLESALSWRENEPLHDVASDYSSYALDRLVQLALGADNAADILGRISVLSPADRRRLLLVPQLSRQIEGSDCGSALQWMMEHQAVIATQREMESPLGDIVVVRGEGCWAVDAVARDRLNMAAAILRSDFPAVFHFFEEHTGVIVLRSDGKSFYSSSPERMIGATLLWNIDGDGVSVEMIAEALLHEAVHSLLDMDSALRTVGLGRGAPWMPADLLHDGVSRTLSPWTSAPLSVAIFIHACVVWYALFNFWTLALATPGLHFSEDEIIRLLRRATAGFFHCPEAQLRRFENSLAPDISVGIQAMAERVRNALAETVT